MNKNDDKKLKDEDDKQNVSDIDLTDSDIEEEIPEEESVSELEQLKSQLEDSDNSYKRAIADYQNLQKRVDEARRDLIMTANRDLLLRILTVLDTLVLAQKHDESESLKVSINQFLDVLKSEGVAKMEAVGQDFDPHLMECVAIEKGDENKVIEELRAGYILNDKVLRPAQVKVGKAV